MTITSQPTCRRWSWTHARVLSVGVVAVVALGLALLQARPTEPATAAHLRTARTIEIDVGDVARVAGAGIGCMVKKKDGAKVLDCRRAGEANGTYGAMFDERRLRIVRFHGEVAKTVFFARHRHSRTKTCG
jgi:hypothetical protein